MRLSAGVIGLVIASTGIVAWAAPHKVGEAEGRKAYLGIHLGGVESADDAEAAGIRVLQIIEGSPAENSGLMKEDVVISVGDRPVDSVEHFVYLMSTYAPGDVADFTVLRDGETVQLAVELGAWPKDGPAAAPGAPGAHKLHKHMFRVAPGWHGNFEGLGEIIGDAAGKDVNVDVDCNNGEGTVRIEIDGEVQEHNFPCGPEAGKNVWMFHGTPGGDPPMGMDFDLDIPGVTQGGLKLFRGFGGEPSTTFEENSDGTITVRVRKGDSQLVKHYNSVQAMPDNLRNQYEELNSAIGE